jgi:pseudouridine-5'-phosphate glycosidase
MKEYLHLSPSIEQALAVGAPVVALESTVMTHGLPYPQNVETALAMEAAVRSSGALPATIAVLGGRLAVGLSLDDIERLGRLAGSDSVRKCSRRDLPIAIACRQDGATTVAGTMIIAHLAGIELFATGGIGGVHRGHPFDISADLRELGKTPVTVVSSGAKSILDLAATREVLETEGVTVVGYGTDELPAFFARSSGLPVDVRLNSPTEVCELILARRRLGLNSGTLVAVPAPESASMDPQEAEAAAAQAAREADERGIYGAGATPWLLKRVVELTEGRSMAANTALLQNNGRVAAEIAVTLSREMERG